MKIIGIHAPTQSQILSVATSLFAAVSLLNDDLPKIIATGVSVPLSFVRLVQVACIIIPVFCRSLRPKNSGIVDDKTLTDDTTKG